ncbi:MAG: DUF6588 family protein [Chloroflexota bacterium]
MIRQTFKRSGLLLSALLFFYSASFAQVDNFDFLRSVPQDAEKFLKSYMEPWTNAFGAGLNGGWYNTAKPHKPLGFDITTSFNVGVVPSSATSFNMANIGLSPSVSGTGQTPTIAGKNQEGPVMQYKSGNNVLATFNAPPGTGFRFLPVPTLQVGLGLPLGTEIKVRFIPRIRIKDDGDIGLWGVGLIHNLTQYLPGDKLLPFDVSLFAGYTKMDGNIALSILPDPTMSNYTSPYNISTTFDDQNLNIVSSGLNVSAIGSFNLPVITFYGGLGYSKTKTELGLAGYFPTPTLVGATPQYNNDGVKKETDFKGIDIQNFSGLRANIGFRIKLAALTIHADYTRAQYNVLSAGLGISVR